MRLRDLLFSPMDAGDLEEVILDQSSRLDVLESDDGPLDEIPQGEAVVVPSWGDMVASARCRAGEGRSLNELFGQVELEAQDRELHELRKDFGRVHELDQIDVAIAVFAGILSAVVDTVLVGIPKRTSGGLRAGSLENYVRDKFEEWLPEEEMEKLASSAAAKVSYDAPYNRGFTDIEVEGLWPTMHRVYSVGHDPLLGLVVGTHDILSGRMTTIDKMGRIVVQDMPRYAGREERDLFSAICKQIIHMKTDVNTSMGLPAPLMCLFSLAQFGDIGEEGLTVAEIVQSMYYEGYDFQHFCAQSITVMLLEATVRLLYFAKRVSEGYPAKESIPFSLDRAKHPKLATMLFLAHSTASGLNAGKVMFMKDPMEIDYPEMVAFATYAFQQAKWTFFDKPRLEHEHVIGKIMDDIDEIGKASNAVLESMGVEVVYL